MFFYIHCSIFIGAIKISDVKVDIMLEPSEILPLIIMDILHIYN